MTAILTAGCAGDHVSGIRIETAPALPNPIGYAGMAAAFSSRTLIAAGGANFPDRMPWEGGQKHFSRDIFVFDGARWEKRGELPRPVAYAAFAGTPEGLIVAGGCDAHTCLAETRRVNLRTGIVDNLPSLPAPVAFAACAVAGGRLYVVGGQDSLTATHALDTVFSLDLTGIENGWERLPPLPGKARILACAGDADGQIHVMGGVSLSSGANGNPVRTYLKDTYVFDPKTRNWRRGHDLDSPLAAAPSPAPFIRGAFVIAGGDGGAFVASGQPPSRHPGQPADIRIFIPETGGTRDAGRLPVGVVTAPVAIRGEGEAYIVSGESAPGVRTPQVVRITAP